MNQEWVMLKKRVEMSNDDASVSAYARHGTTIKWSSTLAYRWRKLDWGWAVDERQVLKGMK